MQFNQITYLDKHLLLVAHYLSGQQLFVVGGAVRDLVLGVNLQPHDIDMTLAAQPDDVYAALQKASNEEFALFRTEKFGTATLINRSDETSYEITPFREEGIYSDNRHPDEIRWSTSLIADAKRRDFTINSLYYASVTLHDKKGESTPSNDDVEEFSPEDTIQALSKHGRYYIRSLGLLVVQNHAFVETVFAHGVFHAEEFTKWFKEHIGEDQPIPSIARFIIDPFLGMQDLENKKLRCVGNPEDRFQEDALRILRGVRHVNILNQKLSSGNFDFEKETRTAMQKLHELVPGLAKERLHQEIQKVFEGQNPFGRIALIDELGLLEKLFPALARNKHDDQPVRYHPFDTYSHTLLTLWHLQQLNTNYLVKLGMLYHDVGKKDQYEQYALATTKEEQQEIHNSPANHVICGPIYVDADFRELGFSNKEVEEIQFYVAQHMRPGQILTARPDNQIKRMRQLLSEYGYEKVRNLLDITVADRKGQFNPLQGNEVDAVQSLYEILEKLYQEEGQFTRHDLAINGDDLMREFDLQPGPKIKELLTAAFDRVMNDIAQRNTKEAVLTYLHSLEP